MTDTIADKRATRDGAEIINTPTLNKGTAFTQDERQELGLQGLLPPHVETLDEQVGRAYEAYQREEHDLARHIFLRDLQDTNEVLFYRLLLDHVVEMLPIVYTPVVGQGCQEFSRIYQQSRGLFISYPHKDTIRNSLRNRPNKDIDVIVVTDGERILGIGDQGVGGLGIPIGKLSLYSLIGGIHPDRTLPIVLDVGTNNQERLDDPEYLGWRHERVAGKDYDDFIEAFVEAVKEELPDVCLQWEDFATTHARPILERYRDQLLTFNDDVQGTASVVLGAITGAINVTGGALRDQKIVMVGAGSAGIGVADYLRAALVSDGLTEEEARRHFWVVDKDGLLDDSRTDLQADQAVYAQPASSVSEWPRSAAGQIDLPQVVDQVQPTILIGLSTVKGAFTEEVVRAMASHVDRPIIFPLSNPTSHSEATAEDLINWTEGRALVASGSPFLPVTYQGRTIPIGQCNNVYIFPAVGLGLVASGANRVTDLMMVAAGRALGAASPALSDPNAPLLPALTDVRNVAVEVAVAVGMEAQRAGVAPQTSEEDLRAKVIATQWAPEYDQVQANTTGEGE
jgi:malate dehydrogenase (oxaloacetate-decarboxylating)